MQMNLFAPISCTYTQPGATCVDSCHANGAKVRANTFRRKKLKRTSQTILNEVA